MPIEFKVVTNKNFFDKLKKASGGQIEKEIPLWLEALGIELLRITEDEIKNLQVVDTRKLLQSFTKDDENNVWRISNGGLSIEVGTSLHYAAHVNYGHNLNPKGVETRFVPGVWHGDHFEYIPGAKTGMVLKQQYIDPQPYWSHAMDIFKKMFPELVNAKFRQWIRRYMK